MKDDPREQEMDDFTGTWIPAMVWEMLDEGKITPMDFLVAITIDRFMDADGFARIKEEFLAELLYPDLMHKVQWHLKRLEEKGIIEIISTSKSKGRKTFVLRTWSLPHDALMKIVRNHERQT